MFDKDLEIPLYHSGFIDIRILNVYLSEDQSSLLVVSKAQWTNHRSNGANAKHTLYATVEVSSNKFMPIEHFILIPENAPLPESEMSYAPIFYQETPDHKVVGQQAILELKNATCLYSNQNNEEKEHENYSKVTGWSSVPRKANTVNAEHIENTGKKCLSISKEVNNANADRSTSLGSALTLASVGIFAVGVVYCASKLIQADRGSMNFP